MKTQIAAIIVILFASSFSVFAADYTWNNSAGGIFGDANNWTPTGVPGVSGGDNAHFTLSASYTVMLEKSYNNDALCVDGSEVMLNLGGFNYVLDCFLESGLSTVIGESGQGGLTINNGNVYSREISIGELADSTGSLRLSGSAASWTTLYEENWHGVWIGEYGNANLSILDNAHFNHGHGVSAYDIQSSVVVDVNGTDSEWYVDGQFDMSVSGSTTVNITNGGLADIGKLIMALERSSSAQINITGQSHESELQLRANLENSLTLAQYGRGIIQVYGSKILNAGTMTIGENIGSNGLLEIHQGSWVDCSNSAAVGGSLISAGGTGQISIIDENPEDANSAEFTPTQLAGQFVKVWHNGKIVMDGGELEAEYGDGLANPVILQGGTLQGNGTVWAYVANIGGVVEPSDEEDNKKLEIGYNYTQDAAGTLKITIAGTEPASQYAYLQVANGQVSLNGILDVDLVDDFVPSYDDEYTIITAQNITGTFSNGVSQYVFEGGSFDVIYNTDSVILTNYSEEPICPQYPRADLNKDCRVNMSDFAILADEWLECVLVPDCGVTE